jgi:predicted AAA+ superfamily ATPase
MYVERELKQKFEKLSKTYNIVALVGPRQAGKTTFLKERSKGVKSTYILFDNPYPRSVFEENVNKFQKLYMQGFDVSIFDEVQYCKDAGRNLKYLGDTGRKIWLTSSSEIILGKEVLSYLVGRVSVLRLYPFSLTEFLSARGHNETSQLILSGDMWEHITYGGYPKVVLTDDIETKKAILTDLYETMILKDVSRTFSIEDVKSLEDFAKYVSINNGSIFSYDKVSSDIKISFRTVKKYLDAMEKSYIIASVPPFYKNSTKEITKQPKIYFLDTGLRNAVVKSFNQEPDGKLFENYVFSELMKLGLKPKYWRTKTGQEVDFIV